MLLHHVSDAAVMAQGTLHNDPVPDCQGNMTAGGGIGIDVGDSSSDMQRTWYAVAGMR